MSFDTACKIIKSEMQFMRGTTLYERIDFRFFGGEPLMQFLLIRDICEWAWARDWGVRYHFYVITNGTLLDSERQKWFESNKKRITIDLSVDGLDVMHRTNRGCSVRSLPIDWVKKNWPSSRYKMTISSKTLSSFADGVISLVGQGYDISSALAIGEHWSDETAREYACQWQKILKYYLTVTGGTVWKQLFKSIDSLFSNQKVQDKCCGAGDSAITYDIDGEIYPCVIFTPLVFGRDIRPDLANIQFTNPDVFADETCQDCFIRNMCKTCYGFNLQMRGKLSERDKSACKMYQLEILYIAAFQMNYIKRLSQKRTLSVLEHTRLIRVGKICDVLSPILDINRDMLQIVK